LKSADAPWEKGKIKQCQQRRIACIEMSALVIYERKKVTNSKRGFSRERGFHSTLTLNNQQRARENL